MCNQGFPPMSNIAQGYMI